MKKPPRHPHRRKAKPDRPDRPYNTGSNERASQIHWRAERQETSRRPRLSREVAVLYEDYAVIVLNKPAGLLAVPIK
jgi:23S rRNA-/tRNA-specific pseudouridylate synthase